MRGARKIAMMNRQAGFPRRLLPAVRALWDAGNKADVIYRLTNIIPNATFSDGLTGWTIVGGTAVVSNGALVTTGNGGSNYVGPTSPASTNKLINGKKYYGRIMARSRSSLCTNLLFSIYKSDQNFGASIKNQANPVVDQWYTMSNVATISSDLSNFTAMGAFRGQFNTTADANGAVVECTPMFLLCLTDIFGAGNEPTATEIDDILSKSPVEIVTKSFNQMIVGGNLLVDGNADNLADGLSLGGSVTNLSLAGGVQSFTPTAQYGGIGFSSVVSYFTPFHIYYGVATVKTTDTQAQLGIQTSITGGIFGMHSGSGNFEKLSSYINCNAASSSMFFLRIRSNATSGWVPIQVKNFMLFDLTAIFGVGNEPTKAEMDAFISAIEYFEGASVKSISKVIQNWEGVKTAKCNPSGKYFLADTVGKIQPIYGTLNQFTAGNFTNVNEWANLLGITWSVSNNIATITNLGASANLWKLYKSYVQLGNTIIGHMYYACEYMKSNSSSDSISWTYRNVQSHSGSGAWEFLSSLSVATSTTDGPYALGTARTGDISANPVQIKQFMAFDLTAIFGAGSEPTKPQMDAIIQKIGVYFEGARNNVLLNPGDENQFGQGHHMKLWNMAYTASSGPQDNPPCLLSDGVDDWWGRAEYQLIPPNQSFSMFCILYPLNINMTPIAYGFRDSFTSTPSMYNRSSTNVGVGIADSVSGSIGMATIEKVLSVGLWASLTLTYDYQTKKLTAYLNGTKVAENTVNGNMAVNYYRSCRDSGGSGYYTAKSGIEIPFNKALTAQEVKLLHGGFAKKYNMPKA